MLARVCVCLRLRSFLGDLGGRCGVLHSLTRMPVWKFVESIMGFGEDISILSFVLSSHKDERDREACLGVSVRDRITREDLVE